MVSIPISLTVRVAPTPSKPFFSSISKGKLSNLVPRGTCKDGGLVSTTTLFRVLGAGGVPGGGVPGGVPGGLVGGSR